MSKVTKIITRPNLKSFVGAIQNAVRDGWEMDPFSTPTCVNGSYTVVLEQDIKTGDQVTKDTNTSVSKSRKAVNCGNSHSPTLPASWNSKYRAEV